jgi:DeoR/GlpR family transcriptional regulator of sugar metabolism
LTTKEDHIEWRRAKIMELSSQGYSEREIVAKLQSPSKSTIHNDLVYLRKEAQESLQHHIHEVVPEENQRCIYLHSFTNPESGHYRSTSLIILLVLFLEVPYLYTQRLVYWMLTPATS